MPRYFVDSIMDMTRCLVSSGLIRSRLFGILSIAAWKYERKESAIPAFLYVILFRFPLSVIHIERHSAVPNLL